MTAPTPPEPPSASEFAAATADLQRLQELMRNVARGEADLSEVQRSLTGYWTDHSQALAVAATAMSEEVRAQMLEQLYGWRDQLGRQVAGQQTPGPDPSPDEPDDRAAP